MDYLAAGRPAISPSHSAIADYFDGSMGFLVNSHPEPTFWPQDPQRLLLTSWHRLVMPSFIECLKQSHAVATAADGQYEDLAGCARQRMRQWSHPEIVSERLESVFREILDGGRSAELAHSNPALSRAA